MSTLTRKRRELSDSDRRRIHERGQSRRDYARAAPRVLRAAGVRLEKTTAEKLRALTGERKEWQRQAWGYRDLIGELRGALQFRARNIMRARFFVAEVLDDDDEPIPVAHRHERDADGNPTERAQRVTVSPELCAAAEAELARLPLDAGFSFLGVWSENFDVAGECWLYGRVHPDTGVEEWSIRAFDDVQPQGNNVTIRDELGQPRMVDLSENSGEELYRLWVPHPRHPHLADSALNACIDVLEDICLTGREMRAASRSRIAANGILKVPVGLLNQRNVNEDDEREPVDRFQADLTAAFLAPISNEGEPGAVVPAMIWGSIEDLQALEHLRFEREDSPTLIDKQKNSLGRMGNSIDVPPEIITGMADVNHWTAWQIDASTFRNYLEPGLRLMVDSLTGCFLRSALRGQFPAEELKKIRIWYDAGSITENPNRRQDTLDAWDRGSISPDTLRRELGFNDGDAPTMEEMLIMVAMRQGFDAGAVAKVLAWAAQQEGVDLPDISATNPTTVRGLPPGTAAPTPNPPSPTGVGGTGAPASDRPVTGGGRVWSPPALSLKVPYPESSFVAAQGKREFTSDSPKWRLDSGTGRKLADLERALMEQLLLAADAAVTNALRKAGSRLRSKAQKDQALTLELRPYPVGTWAMRMGREQAFALGADLRFLLADAFNTLGAEFGKFVGRTVVKIVDQVLRLLKIKPDSREGRTTRERMTSDMAARTDQAWNDLHAALAARAERLLFDGEGEPLADGETTSVIVPPWMVRNALAHVGGMPETASGFNERGNVPTGEPITGLADGTTVTGELAAHGVLPLGREWQYNPTLVRHTFEPHLDLDGLRFTSWSDESLRTDIHTAWIGPYYRPGDHEGCLCTSVPTYAIPDTPPPTPPGQDAPTPADERDWNKALADQLRERLRQPSQDMAYTIELAESDDAAGRRGTVAQRTRDEWVEVQRLQARFLNGE